MRLKTVFASSLLCASLFSLFGLAHAVDHNNLDEGHPLEFDDAGAVAYREQSVEFSLGTAKPEKGKAQVQGSVEYLYGFARNSHFSIGVDSAWRDDGDGKRRWDAGEVSLGVFHNFNREYGNVPALSLRADAYLPTGRDSQGVDFRLRGIASKQWGARGRLYLNLDAFFKGNADGDERGFVPGIIVGYSRPLGYPARFDRTVLAQFGYKANSLKGENGVATVGVGLRQQIGVQSVFDIGMLSDLSGGPSREKWKLTVGYSRQF